MKKLMFFTLLICFLFAGCSSLESQKAFETEPERAELVTEVTETISTTATTEQTASASKIYPLPDTTMDNLSDTILSISLEEGNAYVDDTGKMQMDLKIFSYDQYDMVDIANLKVGDTLIRHSGEVEVISLEQNESGRIFINGGLDNGGFELVTDEHGIFYEMGYNDHKNWYQIGEATIRVSADFKGIDRADLELGEVIIYPGDFLIGAVTNYDFTPYNTTIRIEAGQIIEMNRRYIP